MMSRSITACLLASLLPVLAGCGGGAAPAPSPREAVKEKLRRVVSMKVEKELVDEALARIGREHGLVFRIDTEALLARRAQWRVPTPPVVSVDVRNIQLGSALSVLLDDAELGYEIVGGTIQVAPLDKLPELEVGRVYPVADLPVPDSYQAIYQPFSSGTIHGGTGNYDPFASQVPPISPETDVVSSEESTAFALRMLFPSDIDRPSEVPLPGPQPDFGPLDLPEGIATRPGVVVVSRPPSVQDQIAELLADVRQLLDPVSPPPAPRLTAAEAAIEAALAKPVTVSYRGKPLTEVARELAQRHGINVLIDRVELDGIGLVPEETLMIFETPGQPLPLRDVLRLMLHERDLGFAVAHECLWITVKDGPYYRPFQTLRLYSTDGLTDCVADAFDVTDLVFNQIHPETWDDAGGTCVLEEVPGGIVVLAHWETHEAVAAFLTRLRDATSPLVADYDPAAPPSPHHQRTEAKLDEMTQCDFDKATLDAVARYFSKKHGLPIRFDTLALRDADIAPYHTFITLGVRDLSLRTALRAMSREHGLGFFIDRSGRMLTITSKDHADQQLVPRIYRIGGLIDEKHGPGVEELIEAIENTIHPDSWENAGGPGMIGDFGPTLVVTHTDEVQREIAQFLDALSQYRVDPPRRFDYDASPHKAATAWLEKKLAEKTRIDFDEIPQFDAIKQLGRRHGLPIVFDRDELGRGPERTLVTRSAKDISLRAGLGLILHDLGLDFAFDPDRRALVVSSKRACDEWLTLSTRFYGLGGILGTVGADPMLLEEAFINIVLPDSWLQAGGEGEIAVVGPALVVRQSDRGHREVRQVLDGLSQLLVDPPPGLDYDPSPDKADMAWLEEKLREPTEFKFEETPFPDVISQLAKRHGVRMVIHHQALEDVNIVPKDLLITRTLKRVSLRTGLRLMLKDYDLDFVLDPRQRALVVTTRDQVEARLTTRLYRVDSLLGKTGYDIDSLVDMLSDVVYPISWQETGGPGGISYLGPVLIVSQTDQTHREIRQVLAALSRFVSKQPPTADLVIADANYHKLQAALDKPATIAMKDGSLTALRELLSQKRPDVVFDLDRRGLEDANIVAEDFDLSADFKDVPLRELLDGICQANKLGWVIEDNVIQITSADAAAETFTPLTIYHIPAKLRTAGADEGKLSEIIQAHVSPNEAWQNSPAGGTSLIHEVPGGVIVLNVYPYARQTRRFMDWLRKQPDLKRVIQQLYQKVPKRPKAPQGWPGGIPVVGGLPERGAR